MELPVEVGTHAHTRVPAHTHAHAPPPACVVMTAPARLDGWAPGAKGCSGNQTLKVSNRRRQSLHLCIDSFNPPCIFPEGLLSTRHGHRCVTTRSGCCLRSTRLPQCPRASLASPRVSLLQRQPQASSRGARQTQRGIVVISFPAAAPCQVSAGSAGSGTVERAVGWG